MSDYSKSTNFTNKDTLPTGNSGKIVKGTELDTEFTAISSAIASKADISSPALLGTPTAPTATVGTNTIQLANTAFVTAALAILVPTGVITMWSGSIASIPSGWYLCNGSNSTPDLRNKFVVGAGTTYAVGATGGSADAIVVSHTHTITDSGHTHGLHYKGDSGSLNGNSPATALGASDRTDTGFIDANTASGYGISSSTTGITNNSTGVSGTNANLPPYYALAYIMKA